MNESYQMEPHQLYWKALVSGRLSAEEEAIILRSPKYAYYYAKNVIKGRWSEGESIIATDPYYAYVYARDVIEGRWLEAEKIIASSAEWACMVLCNICDQGKMGWRVCPIGREDYCFFCYICMLLCYGIY